MAEAAPHAQSTTRPPPQHGPYILRKLVADLPLSADGAAADVRITCVEVSSMCTSHGACALLS
tara:strand:+ start:5513 stop:5701 length:189 start_codon:yes stop_codon:yes gene_type:complete